MRCLRSQWPKPLEIVTEELEALWQLLAAGQGVIEDRSVAYDLLLKGWATYVEPGVLAITEAGQETVRQAMQVRLSGILLATLLQLLQPENRIVVLYGSTWMNEPNQYGKAAPIPKNTLESLYAAGWVAKEYPQAHYLADNQSYRITDAGRQAISNYCRKHPR